MSNVFNSSIISNSDCKRSQLLGLGSSDADGLLGDSLLDGSLDLSLFRDSGVDFDLKLGRLDDAWVILLGSLQVSSELLVDLKTVKNPYRRQETVQWNQKPPFEPKLD